MNINSLKVSDLKKERERQVQVSSKGGEKFAAPEADARAI